MPGFSNYVPEVKDIFQEPLPVEKIHTQLQHSYIHVYIYYCAISLHLVVSLVIIFTAPE